MLERMKKKYTSIILCSIIFVVLISVIFICNDRRMKADYCIDKLLYDDYKLIFISDNHIIIDGFSIILNEHRIPLRDLSLINTAAKEIIEYLPDLTECYEKLYAKNDYSLTSEYQKFISSAIYSETSSLLESSKSCDNGYIIIPDDLIEHYNDIWLNEKLLSVDKAINNFEKTNAAYLERLDETSGKGFVNDALWLTLVMDLNNQVSDYNVVKP
jgi:hypothetical protein